MHSTTSRRPAPFFTSGRSQRGCEVKGVKKKSKRTVMCHFMHIQFDVTITGGQTWKGPQLRSKTGIISTSAAAHFRPERRLQFNNVTLLTARANSSKIQGEKVFILNNHALFGRRSPTSGFMLMLLKDLMWTHVCSLLLHAIYSTYWM